jgi:hypothetical protein
MAPLAIIDGTTQLRIASVEADDHFVHHISHCKPPMCVCNPIEPPSPECPKAVSRHGSQSFVSGSIYPRVRLTWVPFTISFACTCSWWSCVKAVLKKNAAVVP